jgi:hypothetical protein
MVSLAISLVLFVLSLLCITAQDTGRDVQVIQTAQAGQYLQSMFYFKTNKKMNKKRNRRKTQGKKT